MSGLTDFRVPDRTRREHIFVNRFSAPGGPETSCAASRDRESEEYSIYNTINYRNPTIRRVLNELSKEKSEKFGFRLNSSTQGSIHKTNRNPTRSGTGNILYNDNNFIQHHIPQNDFGYSWVTASVADSLYDFLAKHHDIGHQHNYLVSGSVHSSRTLNFLTEGESHTIYGEGQSSPIRWLDQRQFDTNTNPGGFVEKVPFNGLNTIVVGEVLPETNTIGEIIPTGTVTLDSSNSSHTLAEIRNQAPFINEYRFKNGSLGSHTHRVMYLMGEAPALTLNTLILNRQGPYSWPTWKQISGAEHKVVRSHRKNKKLYS